MGSSNTMFVTEVRFDPSYAKTVPGVIKIIIIIFSLIAFICIQASSFWSNGRGVYFNVIAQFGIWYSVGILFCYLFHIVEKYHNWKWLRIEMIADVAFVFLYLTTSTIVVAFGSAAYSAAGFFGYLTMVLFGSDAFIKFNAIKAGELAQGRKVVAKEAHTHIATPPAMP